MTEKATLKFNIRFHQRVVAFSLSMGGWLPVAFTRTSHVLVDRSVIIMLRKIGSVIDRGDHEANKWWFGFLNSSSYALNPFLYAMEGDAQGTPSFENFVSEFDSASKLLRERLPKANIIKYHKESYEGAYEIIEKLLARNIRETTFLINVAPLVAERPSSRNIERIEEKILAETKKNKLSISSFVVLAVLSCLYDDKKGAVPSIGKLLVKPKQEYDEKMAYNVVSDVRCLEALIAMNALAAVSFVTRDKALASFWCAINARNQKIVGNSPSFEINPDYRRLLPRLAEDRIPSLLKGFSSD